MKRDFSYLILLFFVASVLPVKGQDLIPNSSVTGICYAGTNVTRVYIPPPEEFFRKSGEKGGGSITIYYTGFSSQAKTALEYAASILKSMLPSDTRLTIQARWEKVTTGGVLGFSTTTGYEPGWAIDALVPAAYYPVALAEKIAGRSLNSDLAGDLELTINSSVNWYLGTDGKTPVQKYDLVTVVLHEICHGLGFYDSMNTEGTVGYYGFGPSPLIYDTFIENLAGLKLTDTLKFRNPSTGIGSELTGGQLWFDGPLLSRYTSGSRAKLYSPSVFDAGSSVSHLDESATLRADALMTPYIDLGEAIHNPGKLTFSILGDLGWINTRMTHKPLGDTENHLTEVVLSTRIKSDTLYNRNRVGLVYSFDSFLTSDTVLLTSPNSDDLFKTSVAIPSYNINLQYYFFVEDCFLRLYRSPSMFNFMKYQTYIGTDTVKPVITHTPVAYYLEAVDSIKFKAAAKDNIGMDTVYVEYIINDRTPKYIGLTAGIDDIYSTSIKTRLLALNGGDSIRYRIFAVDSANIANSAVLPKEGYFVTPIEDIGTVVESYATDFSTAVPDFFNLGFNILKPKDFIKYGLHTRHPYESPETNNDSIEYTAMLRHPLKLTESGLLINFNETVLVEPGEAGSVFGSPDFYDYVIVEASADFGKSWFGLTDGYDSRYSSTWETDYNSSIFDGNSTFTGTESMLQKHTIYFRPSQTVPAGDTLLIRFRLYSDPFANGWGWMIEDLKINPLIDAVENPESGKIIVYPNPGKGVIRLSTYQAGNNVSKPVRFSVYNSSGLCILNDTTSGDSETRIDISGYPTGLYIIVLYRDDGVRTFKYSLIK